MSARQSSRRGTLREGDKSSVPRNLISRDVAAEGLDGFRKIAELISAGQISKIIVLSGAGISTSAGIPDFRSPGKAAASQRFLHPGTF